MRKMPQLLPSIAVIGILLFVCLYVAATIYYPGGSQQNVHSTGFSWLHNYWCNLLSARAINGEVNKAQPIAILALCLLCVSLSIFWICFAMQCIQITWLRFGVKISGVISMLITLFLFLPDYHELIINLASFVGLVAMSGTMYGLFQKRKITLLVVGFINLLLIAVNNYFYYHKNLIVYLPLIQKISFAFFLCWILAIALSLLNQNKAIKKTN